MDGEHTGYRPQDCKELDTTEATYHAFRCQPLASTILPSVSVDLPVLNISYKLNHITYGLLCLASLNQQNIFNVHSCCSRYQYFILFYALLIFHCIDAPCCLSCPKTDGHLGYFYFLAIVYNSASMKLHVQVFV